MHAIEQTRASMATFEFVLEIFFLIVRFDTKDKQMYLYSETETDVNEEVDCCTLINAIITTKTITGYSK